ncbi:MAG: SPOR domain-containing protein [Parvularculaceae bacterium]
MTAAAKADAFDDEIDELEDFDEGDGEDERGLSGLVVLLMGVVMLGALASVVWIAYQYGLKDGEQRVAGTPYVTADPEPLKIENQVAGAAGAGREVYDAVSGAASEPVEVIAAGPEEPVVRNPADPIGAIVAGDTVGLADDAVADRIAALAREDEALAKEPAPVAAPPKAEPKVEPKPATTPTPASVAKPAPAAAASGDALAGSHVVQVGAFRSQGEADGQWTKLQGKLGAFFDGKAKDVEVADLGAKGVYYRLRVGPFASADEAKTWCAGLKERGTDCLIKAK